jgi:putative ABC transport system permease protein
MSTVTLGWALAALLVGLAATAALLVRVSSLGRGRSVLAAALRAAVQLAAVSAVIGFVLRSLGWTIAFLGLMVLIAAGTSARRITGRLVPRSWWTVLPIVAGVVPTLVVIILSTAVPPTPIAVLPVAGILIGGAMTATSLAGRRLTEELTGQRGAYEAALSIGLTRRESVGLIARPAAALALVPGQDQTRTVGLVTLPGAFVGVLLAGAPPLQAGAAQVLVLIALLVVQSAAVAVTVELVANGLLPVGDRPLTV